MFWLEEYNFLRKKKLCWLKTASGSTFTCKKKCIFSYIYEYRNTRLLQSLDSSQYQYFSKIVDYVLDRTIKKRRSYGVGSRLQTEQNNAIKCLFFKWFKRLFCISIFRDDPFWELFADDLLKNDPIYCMMSLLLVCLV